MLGVSDAPYPAEWETDIILGDGSTASLRPIREEDRELLDTFHRRQSEESVYFRFFRYRPELSDKELDYFTQVDYEKRMAFVATVGEELVAVARYEQWKSPNHPGEKRAEVAFFVDDNHHGRGLATIMLEYLAAAGRLQGFDGFTATVLPQNVGMLRVFRKAGFEVTTGFEDGVIEVSLGIEVTDETAEAIEGRERRAQARSIERLIAPTSVAVIGASRRPGSIGHDLVASIIEGGFQGRVIAVNHLADGAEIAGAPSVASVSDVEGPIDLAIVAVPTEAVEGVVQDCIGADVGGLLVVTAGFGDLDESGREAELRLAAMVRSNGLRLIGPNAFGIVNTDQGVSLHALFAPVEISEGPVGLVSQSGPLAGGLLHHLERRGMGVSSMVAIGNRADVSVNDLLQFWHGDDRTSVVAMYLENVGNAKKFSRLARGVSQHKPIVMVAPPDQAMRSMLREAGVVLVGEISSLVKQVEMLVKQPVPRGSCLAVVTNARSIGRLADAAARGAGLDPADVDPTSLLIPREADFAEYERMLVAAAVDTKVDLVLVALVPTPTLPVDRLIELIRRVDRSVDKPMAVTGLFDSDLPDGGDLPVFDYPEGAVVALGRAAEYGRWLQRDQQDEFGLDPEVTEPMQQAALDVLGGAPDVSLTLVDPSLPPLLSALSLPVPSYELASTVDEAVAVAERIGFPVVLKAGGVAERSPGEQGGAALDLHDAADVERVLNRMERSLDDQLWPVIVQRQSTSGFHLSVDITQGWHHGTHVRIGLGGAVGSYVDHSVSTALPLSRQRLAQLIDESWLHRIVPPGPARESLIAVVGQLGAVVDAVPEISHLRADPILVSEASSSIVDIGLELAAADTNPLDAVRHLG